MESTTYLCLVLAVLWSPVVSRVRLALLHTASPHKYGMIDFNAQLSKHHPFLLITEDKGGPTSGHKTKIQFCLTEAGTSDFTIFGKDVSG